MDSNTAVRPHADRPGPDAVPASASVESHQKERLVEAPPTAAAPKPGRLRSQSSGGADAGKGGGRTPPRSNNRRRSRSRNLTLTASQATIPSARGAFKAWPGRQHVAHRVADVPIHLTADATTGLLPLYQRCNPAAFHFDPTHRPRRVLTHPRKPVVRGGKDNEQHNLILAVDDELKSPNSDEVYVVVDLLGVGGFGQVVKCRALTSGRLVAVKVIKSKPNYVKQARTEVEILQTLRRGRCASPRSEHSGSTVSPRGFPPSPRGFAASPRSHRPAASPRSKFSPRTRANSRASAATTPGAGSGAGCGASVGSGTSAAQQAPAANEATVTMLDHFTYCGHPCIVFECLSINLLELLKQNSFRGLPLPLVRRFMVQLLDALAMLDELDIVHSDIKPENVLMAEFSASDRIKLIDFGSACFSRGQAFLYLQSRFYRSPEVLLGLPFDPAIDMWSLGCIAVELFHGLPLFPGRSQFNQLQRICELLGYPPDWMLLVARNTRMYFNRKGPAERAEQSTKRRVPPTPAPSPPPTASGTAAFFNLVQDPLGPSASTPAVAPVADAAAPAASVVTSVTAVPAATAVPAGPAPAEPGAEPSATTAAATAAEVEVPAAAAASAAAAAAAAAAGEPAAAREAAAGGDAESNSHCADTAATSAAVAAAAAASATAPSRTTASPASPTHGGARSSRTRVRVPPVTPHTARQFCGNAPAESSFVLKSSRQFAEDMETPVVHSKYYYRPQPLKDLIMKHRLPQRMNEQQLAAELRDRRSFFDFVTGLLRFDIEQRWTPRQARSHPFIQQKPQDTFPFVPPADLDPAGVARRRATAAKAKFARRGSAGRVFRRPRRDLLAPSPLALSNLRSPASTGRVLDVVNSPASGGGVSSPDTTGSATPVSAASLFAVPAAPTLARDPVATTAPPPPPPPPQPTTPTVAPPQVPVPAAAAAPAAGRAPPHVHVPLAPPPPPMQPASPASGAAGAGATGAGPAGATAAHAYMHPAQYPVQYAGYYPAGVRPVPVPPMFMQHHYPPQPGAVMSVMPGQFAGAMMPMVPGHQHMYYGAVPVGVTPTGQHTWVAYNASYPHAARGMGGVSASPGMYMQPGVPTRMGASPYSPMYTNSPLSPRSRPGVVMSPQVYMPGGYQPPSQSPTSPATSPASGGSGPQQQGMDWRPRRSAARRQQRRYSDPQLARRRWRQQQPRQPPRNIVPDSIAQVEEAVAQLEVHAEEPTAAPAAQDDGHGEVSPGAED